MSNRSIEQLVRQWSGLAVVSRFDDETASWIFIALHDDTLGHPVGGTRLKSYPEPADGLLDAMRLARGMTHKWAALGFDSGGGKAVLAIPGPLDATARRGLMLRYGRLIESLRGTFATGRDLGTTDNDMLTLAEVTSHVHGVDRESGETRDPGVYTAVGVLAAIRATAAAALGSGSLRGRRILIQGLGDVGEPLARHLAEAGAELLLADIDRRRAETLSAELGGQVIAADSVYDTDCDIYAPCATGQTLNGETIPRLRCRGVAGSANNQLGADTDAHRLHDRGILYAPDYVANGGGALAFGLIHRGVTDPAEIATRLAAIETALADIFTESAANSEPPLKASHRRVQATLQK